MMIFQQAIKQSYAFIKRYCCPVKVFAKWEGGGVGEGKCFCPSRSLLLVTSPAGFFLKTIHHRSFFLPLSLPPHPAMEEKRNNSSFPLGTQARNLKF